MRARKWLLTSVMCGGLVFATGLANEVLASQAKLLQPNSDWAVSKLAAAQTGGQPYCALARRFNNNLILTMARNGQDETSIAIDFQKQALNNTQSYLVSFKPGFNQERSFNVRPVSGKALVIRMGQDYAFHDALNRSGQLEVDVSGQTYAFNLNDYATGQHKLGECLAGLIEPAAGGPDIMTPAPAEPVQRSPIPPATPTLQQAASSAPAVSKPVMPESDTQLQALREENLRLRNALERERRNYEDRYMREGQTSSLVAELSEKVNLLQMENKQLEEQLAYKPAPEVITETCAVQPEPAPEPEMMDWSMDPSIQQELSALKETNLSLKQEVAALQAKNELLEKQGTQKAEVDADEAAVVESLRERISKLETENEKLKITNASYEKGGGDVPVSLAQLRAVEEQLRNVQRDRDTLLSQINAVSQSKTDKLLDISSDNWNLEQATRRFNEAEKEIRRLGRELEEQRMHCSMEKKELEYMLFDPTVATQEQISRLTKLEETVVEARALLDSQQAVFDEKIAALSSQAESATITLDIQRAEYEQKLAVLKEELALREEEVASSRERLAGLESELAKKLQVASVEAQQQIALLKSELERADTDRAVLAAQKVEYEDKLAALEQQLISNNELSEGSRQRIASLEKELSEVREAYASVEEAGDTAQIAALIAENDELVHQRNLLEQERNKLSDESYRLNQKVSSLESSLANIQTAAGGSAKGAPVGLPAPVAAEPIDAAPDRAVDTNIDEGAATQIYAYKDFGNSVEQNVAAAAPSSASLMTPSALKTILGLAQIEIQGGIQKDSAPGSDIAAYSWNTGSLYGSAEQQLISGAGQFDKMVNTYLAKTKTRCQGDFAAVPAISEQKGSLRVSSYEIACITGQGGASASIVFYNDGQTFTAIAHETGIDNMATAMDTRDNLVGSLLQTQIASR